MLRDRAGMVVVNCRMLSVGKIESVVKPWASKVIECLVNSEQAKTPSVMDAKIRDRES
jgi:hypothetical protein